MGYYAIWNKVWLCRFEFKVMRDELVKTTDCFTTAYAKSYPEESKILKEKRGHEQGSFMFVFINEWNQ